MTAQTSERRTYRYEIISPDTISSKDLRAEYQYQYAKGNGEGAEACTIIITRPDGTTEPEAAEALYFPGAGRLGIAWGADATWADAKGLESGIEMWLNDNEEWEARN